MMDKITAWLNAAGDYLALTVLPMLLIAVVGILLIRGIMKVITRLLEKSKLEKAAHTLVKTVIRTVLYGLLLLILASRLGIDVTGIIALASVLTLAVSLAVQDALTNMISGFTLIYTKPFSSGDFVEIAGQSGTVLEIGLPYTQLVTGDNKKVYIPNSAVTSAEIVNYSVQGTRRIDILVTASYDAPVETVLTALREAGGVSELVLREPAAVAAVTNYGDSAIEYELRVWCAANDYWQARVETNQNIKAAFDKYGIEMTYPHLNVHLDK